jgi:hypothetical protein
MFLVMFGLIAIELPVAFALVAAALAWLQFSSPVPISLVVQRMSSGIDSFPLLAIPLFVLAGNLMNIGGIASRIFEFAVALVGHLRGGLAQVNIFASLIFAGMSGVAQADAAGAGDDPRARLVVDVDNVRAEVVADDGGGGGSDQFKSCAPGDGLMHRGRVWKVYSPGFWRCQAQAVSIIE